jgi:DnaK suppressor protein
MASSKNEKTAYSRTDLEEFRTIITTKLTESREEYKLAQESLRSSNEQAADGYNMTEFGSEMHDREQNEMLLARTGKFIDALERALVRVENGTYGRCKVTGKLIPKERLRLVPHTETSMEAKLAQQNQPKPLVNVLEDMGFDSTEES